MDPKVVCVMVTGKSPDRKPFALAAIESFRQQTYPNKQLLIINDGPESLVGLSALPDILEVRAFENLSLGELRNLGLLYARRLSGEWVMQWDDDDFYHPLRIQYMMDRRKDDHAILLLNQIRYSFANGNAMSLRYDRPMEGIPGTILHPMTKARYPDEGKHEDSHFLNTAFDDRRVIIDNGSDEFPGPALYLRFYNGLNTWDSKHIMRRMADPAIQNQWRMRAEHAQYLHEVLTTYYGVKHTPLFESH